MNKITFLLIFLLIVPYRIFSSEINYMDPLPNSHYVNTESSLIFGFSKFLNESLINNNIIVYGSKSGFHYGIIKLSEKGKKIIFKPQSPFLLNERIDVSIDNLISTDGTHIHAYSYSFYTQGSKISVNPLKIMEEEIGIKNFKDQNWLKWQYRGKI